MLGKNYLKIALLLSYSIITISFTTNLPLKNSNNKSPLITPMCMNNINSISHNNLRRNSTNNISTSVELSLRNDIPMLMMSNNITDVKKNNLINNKTEDCKKKYSKGCIKKVDFDTIFLRIFNINKVYFSSINDRVIVCYDDGNKNVYYMDSDDDKKRINHLINLTNKIKIIIISDYHNAMDSIYGPLYCEKKDI